MGGHLLTRRTQAGRTQWQVARQLGVNTWTYGLWETDRTKPTVRYYPAIFRFLGYEPFPAALTLPERIAAQRRELGLSHRSAAAKAGVDEGTFRRWESGAWKPRLSRVAVDRFLKTPAPPPPVTDDGESVNDAVARWRADREGRR
ncbi:MAG: helix-turn-helix domain-containing protein [Rhizomicrobium sp.]